MKYPTDDLKPQTGGGPVIRKTGPELDENWPDPN